MKLRLHKDELGYNEMIGGDEYDPVEFDMSKFDIHFHDGAIQEASKYIEHKGEDPGLILQVHFFSNSGEGTRPYIYLFMRRGVYRYCIATVNNPPVDTKSENYPVTADRLLKYCREHIMALDFFPKYPIQLNYDPYYR